LKREDFEEATREAKAASERDRGSNEIQHLLQRCEAALKQSKTKDYYKILGVSRSAEQGEIKKAYRKLVLEKHPDKLAENERETGRSEFLKIQEAFEVLSVDRNRRMYDSSLSFDDTIPSFTEGEDDFFEVFPGAFERNSRWSVIRPVPSLGTKDSSKSHVDSFYEFWYSFESWRDFSHHDEYDLSHAESRDERRWMEVQNGRIRKKKIQEFWKCTKRQPINNIYLNKPHLLNIK
jgi:DnaJ family protein C protein 2